VRPVYEWKSANANKATGPIRRTSIAYEIKQTWAANVEQVLTFRIVNPMVIAPDYHPPPPIYVSVSLQTTTAGQKYINDTLMVVDAMTVHGGIQGSRVPLAVWSDTWPKCFKSPVSKGLTDSVWRDLLQTHPRKP